MSISLQEILTQMLAFTLLVWVLKRFAWGPLIQILEERRSRIKSGLEEIETSKIELEKLRLKHEDALQHIEEEARKKLQEAVQEGKAVARELQEEARQQAKEILAKAKDDIQLEVDKARITLRDEIAGITLQATEHLIQKKVDAEKDKEIVLDFIRELEQNS